MKILVKQLGSLEQAEFELGELTIICGANNTGKTYATHATYGFFDYLKYGFDLSLEQEAIDKLFAEGNLLLFLEPYVKKIPEYLKTASKNYSENLYRVFAGNEKLFEKSFFNFSLTDNYDLKPLGIQTKIGSAERSLLKIQSTENDSALDISFIVDKNSDEVPPKHVIKNMISDCIRTALFGKIIPKPFLASAERTGAAIFQKELDFTRNRLVELLGDKSAQLSPIQFLGKFSGEYPIAVRKNVDFIRDIPNISSREGYIIKHHPQLLKNFQNIIGGEYIVSKDGEINYVPTGKRTKLSLVESSSAVRSLLDVGFYLRHIAQPGDLLMIDEPELNLHPENQRKIARLFVSLINIGIKVFISTHSDYIIKELNTLIMLNQDKAHLKKIMKEEKYSEDELLDADKVKVYIAREDKIKKAGNKRRSTCLTLVPAGIDPELGIEAESFDITIDKMNRIQDEIVWGDE
jgi:hypothetical protein